MYVTAPIALFGFLFLSLVVFALIPAHRAVITVLIGGYMFLPQAEIFFSGLPEFNRFSSISYGLLLGVVMFDWRRLSSFKISIYDLPMLIWCLSPLATSFSNNLGMYDGISLIEGQLVVWLVPYLIGRIYFSDQDSIKLFVVAIIGMGLIAALMCWFEIRMYPKLHFWTYGFQATKTHMFERLGGIRPILFLKHGIEVGLLMAFCALTAVWIWKSGMVRAIKGLPMSMVSVFLLLTAVFVRSIGAMACLALGLTVLLSVMLVKSRLPLVLILCLPIAYVSARATGAWYPTTLIQEINEFDSDRARSFESRLNSEIQSLAHIWKRPVFGWGEYNRYRSRNDEGRYIVVDSMWLIIFGKYGLVGLVSLGATLLIPGMLVAWKIPPSLWIKPSETPAVVLTVGLTMYVIDCLMNAMPSPIYHATAGAVVGYVINRADSFKILNTQGLQEKNADPCRRVN